MPPVKVGTCTATPCVWKGLEGSALEVWIQLKRVRILNRVELEHFGKRKIGADQRQILYCPLLGTCPRTSGGSGRGVDLAATVAAFAPFSSLVAASFGRINHCVDTS